MVEADGDQVDQEQVPLAFGVVGYLRESREVEEDVFLVVAFH